MDTLAGIVPVKSLPDKYKSSIVVGKFGKIVVMSPLRELVFRFKEIRFVKPEIDAGIVPVKLFPERFRVLMVVGKYPRIVLKSPVIPWLVMFR